MLHVLSHSSLGFSHVHMYDLVLTSIPILSTSFCNRQFIRLSCPLISVEVQR